MDEINFDTSSKLKFEILYMTLRKEYDRQRELEFIIQNKTKHKVVNIHAAELYGFLKQLEEQNATAYLVAEHRYNHLFLKQA